MVFCFVLLLVISFCNADICTRAVSFSFTGMLLDILVLADFQLRWVFCVDLQEEMVAPKIGIHR